MAKSKSKKTRDGAVSMDVSETKTISESVPQAMDTTENTGDTNVAARAHNLLSTRKGKSMKRMGKEARKMKAMAKTNALNEKTTIGKVKPMKRTKNARKMKAVAKAIALNEKYEEKASKNETKTLRTLSAKKLYE